MKTYTRILVALDLTNMDQVMIRYAAHLCRAIPGIEKAYFVHNIRFDYPEEAEALMAGLERPLGELIGEEATEQVEEHFSGSVPEGVSWEVLVAEGASTAQELARMSNEVGAELVLAGKKRSYRGSGAVAEKLLRQSGFKADLMAVPETAPHRLERVLVPIDFSQAASRALKKAHQLAPVVSCQHIYKIPNHYFPFIPVQGFRKSMEEEAKEQYKRFRKALPKEVQDTPCQFIYAEDRTVAQSVYDYAISQGKDLIVLGAKGKSAVPAILLGGTAAQLLKFDFHVPVLIVR